MSDLFPEGCACGSYGRGLTMTRVHRESCPVHGYFSEARRATGKTGRRTTPTTVEPTVEAQGGRPVANGATVAYCYPQCRDPWFQECADCWRDGGNPAFIKAVLDAE
jgi:hypothetical protein